MGKKTGPKTKYHQAYALMALKACLLWGATNEQLASFFDVSERTIQNWRKNNPDFDAALTQGKAFADAEVAHALYRRAIGYSHPEDKLFCHDGEIIGERITKHYPPDTGACLKWLSNRQPEHWREKIEIGATDREGKDVPLGGLVIIPDDADPDTWLRNAMHEQKTMEN